MPPCREPDFHFNCPTWPSPLPLPLALGSWHGFKGPINCLPSPIIILNTSTSPLPKFLGLKSFYVLGFLSSLATTISFLWPLSLSCRTFFFFVILKFSPISCLGLKTQTRSRLLASPPTQSFPNHINIANKPTHLRALPKRSPKKS